MVRLLRN